MIRKSTNPFSQALLSLAISTAILTGAVGCKEKEDTENSKNKTGAKQEIITVEGKEYADVYYSQVDKLRMRKNPDLKEKAIATLAENEKVLFLKEVTREKVTATIRGKEISAPFFKVQKDDGTEEGWVFSGALTEIPPQAFSFDLNKKKRDLKSFESEVQSDIDRLLSDENVEVNASSQTLDKNEFIGLPTNILYTISHGTEECTGGEVETNFFDNGKVIHTEVSLTVYYYGEFKKLENGVYPEMKSDELVKLFKKPYRQNGDVYQYKVDHSYPDYDIQGYVYFFFADDRLAGVAMFMHETC